MSREERLLLLQASDDQVGRAWTNRNSRLNLTFGFTEAAATAASLTGCSARRRAITARAARRPWREAAASSGLQPAYRHGSHADRARTCKFITWVQDDHRSVSVASHVVHSSNFAAQSILDRNSQGGCGATHVAPLSSKSRMRPRDGPPAGLASLGTRPM